MSDLVDELLKRINKVTSGFKDKDVPAYRLSDTSSQFVGTKIPTGDSQIDGLLHGGFPCGKLIEIFGGESSGKTTTVLTMIAGAIKRNPDCVVIFIDAEHALDLAYAKKIGVDPEKVIIQQPDFGEQALDLIKIACEEFIHTKAKNPKAQLIICLDSVAALVPASEFNADTIEQSGGMATQARMMSQSLRQIIGPAYKSDACVVFINQTRDNVGGYGPSATSGGKALKFYASIRIQLSKLGKWDDVDGGIKTKMTVVKSKVFAPFQSVEFFIGPHGIDSWISIVETGVARGVIKKSGAGFEFEEKKVRGKYNFSLELRKDIGLARRIVEAINKAPAIEIVKESKAEEISEEEAKALIE